jgi:hypothetical protein
MDDTALADAAVRIGLLAERQVQRDLKNPALSHADVARHAGETVAAYTVAERWSLFSDAEILELYTNLRSADDAVDWALKEHMFQEVHGELQRRGVLSE